MQRKLHLTAEHPGMKEHESPIDHIHISEVAENGQAQDNNFKQALGKCYFDSKDNMQDAIDLCNACMQ